ncbi:hypothetical protein ACWFQ8_06920 [Streptomyces sp. NPDC055254]
MNKLATTLATVALTAGVLLSGAATATAAPVDTGTGFQWFKPMKPFESLFKPM